MEPGTQYDRRDYYYVNQRPRIPDSNYSNVIDRQVQDKREFIKSCREQQQHTKEN